MSRLSDSLDRLAGPLRDGDLADDTVVRQVLEETTARRTMDLSDLPAAEQAAMIAGRSQQLQPSPSALAERIEEARAKGRPFVAKFGIDPTGAEVHLGHSVPMQILSRFQRMGHHVVFIVGDVTAKIGDPSGRSDDRPPLTDEMIAANLVTYREQVAPFFDFERGAEFRHNGDWLREVTLPRLIEITSRIPLSMSLQRDDFRTRLDAGHGLSLAELLYSVAMALDSVETNCDLEVGGIDQFLNMQMCRKVMEICGQVPELVVATPLMEGTDGTGGKMSKSQGNYVPLTAPAGEVFGKLMSVPDRLIEPYLRALSEWQDAEIAVLRARLDDGSLRPVDAKKLLAGEVTAAIHGVEAATLARADFTARFSRRSFSDVSDLPSAPIGETSLAETVRSLGFAKSNGEVRRLAQQKGIRLVVDQTEFPLGADEIFESVAALVRDRSGDVYLKVGRKLARLS